MPHLNSTALASTSPAAAGTSAAASASGFGEADSLTVVATLAGATGGTLDVYLQTSYDGGTTYVDFCHFPQLAAAAASSIRIWHITRNLAQTTLTTVGSGTTPVLAANAIVGGCWGNHMRLLFVAGASTSAGAAQSVTIAAYS